MELRILSIYIIEKPHCAFGIFSRKIGLSHFLPFHSKKCASPLVRGAAFADKETGIVIFFGLPARE
jgi:hypothetical protein